MPDIFISYSRKDSDAALQLAERLRLERMDVWIDLQGIEAAASWTHAIVEAIDQCKVFILLLSTHSLASSNVVREVSLAYESDRTILPIELEPITLPLSFRYQLAGIQRVRIQDNDAILRALKNNAVGNLYEPRPTPDTRHLTPDTRPQIPDTRHLIPDTRPQPPAGDSRKSLMVLPFEDLSPARDNAWFADGLTSELISSLSNIKTLRLIDRTTSMDFKGFHGRTSEIARDLSVRYFLEGSVRKFGDEVKISLELLDFKEGRHLWTDSYRGKFAEIFDMQEEVAARVVNGLKLKLSDDELRGLFQHGTKSPEAYELSLKANEYFLQQTKLGFEYAVKLWGDAIAIEHEYAYAYQSKANALTALYSDYGGKREILDEAERLVHEAFRLQPDLLVAYHPMTRVYELQGKLKEAEETAREFVRKAPNDFFSHFALGYFYMQSDQPAKAIPVFEEAIRLKPDDYSSYVNLVIVCEAAGDMEKTKYWSAEALPSMERHLKLHPDDEGTLIQYALMLLNLERVEEAREVVHSLQTARDGNTLYNTACLLVKLEEHMEGLRTFCRAIEAGFAQQRLLADWLDEDFESFVGTPEYTLAESLIAKVSREQK